MQNVAEFEKPYSVCVIPDSSVNGCPAFVVGSEAKNGGLYLFEPPEYRPRLLASEPGGFISLWPVSWRHCRSIAASVRFYPFFEAAESQIRFYPLPDGGESNPEIIADVPYTHRIAICRIGGADYLLASTLCSKKDFKDDWSHPGGISIARLDSDSNESPAFRQIATGLTKNHGMDFAMLNADKKGGFLISAQEGLFYARIPDHPESQWTVEKLADGPHSDAFACDWFGAGNPVIFTIGPFHGNILSMYCKIDNTWRQKILADDVEMGHIVWAGSLLGKPALIAGGRKGRQELRLYRDITADDLFPEYELIDEHIGAAQIAVIDHGPEHAMLIVSAHAAGRVRVYELTN